MIYQRIIRQIKQHKQLRIKTSCCMCFMFLYNLETKDLINVKESSAYFQSCGFAAHWEQTPTKQHEGGELN